MFRKGLTLAALAVAVTAVSGYAATSYQVQTKLATAGGTLKVANKASQTVVGTTVYNNFTTAAAVPVVVTPKAGYSISSISKSGVVQTVADPDSYSTSFLKATGTTQSLIASFTVKRLSVSATVTGAGSVTPTSATVNYNGSLSFTATPSAATSYLSSFTVNGVEKVTTPAAGVVTVPVAGITADTTAAATFSTVSASAGSSKVTVNSTATTLRGSGTGTLLWSVVSGPGAIDIAAPTSATTAVTPQALGTYTLKLSSMLNGVELVSSTVTVTSVGSVVDYMRSSCNGCHSPAAVVPSNSFANWSTSSHKAASVSCISCHTDAAMPTPVNSGTVNPANFQVLNASAGTVGTNYCSKCHNYIAIAEHSATAKSDCSVCHNFNAHSLARTPVAGSIATNHVGGSYGGNAQYVTQNITCANCHVGAATGILTEWAESAHGAVDGPAWMTSSSHDWPIYSGGACKRCHTGIGFVNNITGSTTAQVAGVAGQVLDCTSCHSDVAGGVVRTLTGGSYTLPYQIPGTDAAADVITVAGTSQVCLPCHAGRGSGASLTAANAANFNGRFSQHYFNAGATLFAANGYHFAGRDYAAGYHKNIGGDGPCVSCHMNSASAGKGHTFEAVTKTDGVITAINTAAKCAECHTDMTAAKLVASKAAFVAALDVLKAELQTKEGAFYNAADGGFYTAADFLTKKAVWSSKDALGAANNYWLYEHAEPAAYVHNRGYAMKLIADSIDFINDGVIDADSGITVGSLHIAVGTADSTTCTGCHNGAATLAVPHDGAYANDCVSCHNDNGAVIVPAAQTTVAAAHAVADQVVVGPVTVTTGDFDPADADAEVKLTFTVSKDGQPFELPLLFRAYRYNASTTAHLTTGTGPVYNVANDFDRATLTTFATFTQVGGNYEVIINEAPPVANATYMVTLAQDATETKPAATATGVLGTKSRDLVSNTGCFSCHGNNVFGKLHDDGEWGHHGANPQSVDACVVCHTRYSSVSRGLGGDRTTAYVHGIHNSHNMPAGGYDRQFPTKDGVIDFSIGYPTYMTNCTVCHDTAAGKTAVANAPVSYSLCMSCHDTWDSFDHGNTVFGTLDHAGFTYATQCDTCHNGTFARNTVAKFHNGLLTERAGLIYNGEDVSVVEGAKVDMQISSVTRTGASLAVVWTATYAGNPVDPCNTTAAANAPLFINGAANATTGQSAANLNLLRAYVLGDDWGNPGIGTSPGQPANTNITAANTVCASNVATTTLTLTGAELAATGKAVVAIQGKAQVKLPYTYDSPLTPAVEVKDVIQVRSKTPTKEYMIDGSAFTARRAIAENASCLGCHVGSLYQHGGNRIDNVDMCVMCHNEASSEQSVRIYDGVDSTEAYDGKVGQTYGFKSLLHAVHSAGVNDAITMVYRTNGNYVWSKDIAAIPNYPALDVFGATNDGSGVAAVIYGSSAPHGTGAVTEGANKQVYRAHNLHVTHFPQALNNCASCHKANSFGFPDPAKAIATVVNVGSVKANQTAATDAVYGNIADDIVQGPAAAACMSCHATSNTNAANGKTKAWYSNHANGGGFAPVVRTSAGAEKCASCHK